ncbi:hypothetical protein N665_0108s0087 [Sinapis alba]|nr:hypothetical protein N665_0108s0087 [Sinapis alba]
MYRPTQKQLMIYIRRINPRLYTTMTKTLEIDIRSAEGLKLNRRLVNKNTFAVARIGEKSRKSHLDVSRGSSPTWNYKLEMPMNGSVTFIYIEVWYRTSSGREKKIGEAKIPTSDFMGRVQVFVYGGDERLWSMFVASGGDGSVETEVGASVY